jgi:aspartate/methionine/tyrosine aminotransferase
MRQKRSEYMNWAKTQSRTRYNLATSGVAHFPMGELPFDASTLEIHGDNSYGYAPLRAAIAGKHGVDPDCVVEAAGTSMANHLAMAAILEPGDQVLIEHPAYGPILDVARYLEADIRRFPRRPDDCFAIDPAEVRRALTSSTRLIVVTNLHNPSSALTPEPVLRELGELARSVGARVLVDEVYLDAVYEQTPPTAFHLGPEFVITSSLTKVYGVSGLRCGWILAEPELAWRMLHLNDIYAATAVHPAELLSVAVLKHLEILRVRARQIVEADRSVLQQFLETEDRVTATPTQWGTTAFLKMGHGNVDHFLAHLRTKYETSAVPGRFFEMPEYFRVGMGIDSEMFREGLRRLQSALADQFSKVTTSK